LALRIVAGRFRGKILIAPEGEATRPTSDRARQAVFNILEHADWSPGLVDMRVIDLFAGSGALGLEALSRGAAYGLFVETDPDARGAMDYFGVTRIHRRDCAELGAKPAGDGAPFDLAFLDPPYRKGLGEQALAGLLSGGWLAKGAICVWERAADEPPVTVPGFETLDTRTYGAAQVVFLRRD
jgi:16S rRNA (guanine966-N2)-methyltransferase